MKVTKENKIKTNHSSSSWEAENGNQFCKADFRKWVQKFEGFGKHGEMLQAQQHIGQRRERTKGTDKEKSRPWCWWYNEF